METKCCRIRQLIGAKLVRIQQTCFFPLNSNLFLIRFKVRGVLEGTSVVTGGGEIPDPRSNPLFSHTSEVCRKAWRTALLNSPS